MPKNILVVSALKSEYHDADLYTGIGKVNAAYHLTKAIETNVNIEMVLNVGSAGVMPVDKELLGTIVELRSVADFDQKQNGFLKANGMIKLEECFFSLKPKTILPQRDGYTVGTFTNDPKPFHPVKAVVDMEAFALAFVCRKYNIPFISLKYITDIVGRNGDKDFIKNVKKTHYAFKRLLSQPLF